MLTTTCGDYASAVTRSDSMSNAPLHSAPANSTSHLTLPRPNNTTSCTTPAALPPGNIGQPGGRATSATPQAPILEVMNNSTLGETACPCCLMPEVHLCSVYHGSLKLVSMSKSACAHLLQFAPAWQTYAFACASTIAYGCGCGFTHSIMCGAIGGTNVGQDGHFYSALPASFDANEPRHFGTMPLGMTLCWTLSL